MTRATDALRLQPEQLKKNIPGPDGQRFHIGLERGELLIELYVPEQQDLQKPHSRDECYVVIRGAGKFQMGEEIIPFESGDFLFVPAGLPHRFLDFRDSLEVWVMFCGPEGASK